MRCKGMQLALWTLATVLSSVSCLAIDASKVLPAPSVVATVPAVVNAWPWLALGAIVLLLTVIALAARRRLPFGHL